MPTIPRNNGKKRRNERSDVSFTPDGKPNKGATKAFGSNRDTDHHKLYGTSAWRKLRPAILAEFPTCRCCLVEGRVVESTDVDHIIPHALRPDLALDPNALWAICRHHHAKKSAAEGRGVMFETWPEWVYYLTGVMPKVREANDDEDTTDLYNGFII